MTFALPASLSARPPSVTPAYVEHCHNTCRCGLAVLTLVLRSLILLDSLFQTVNRKKKNENQKRKEVENVVKRYSRKKKKKTEKRTFKYARKKVIK